MRLKTFLLLGCLLVDFFHVQAQSEGHSFFSYFVVAGITSDYQIADVAPQGENFQNGYRDPFPTITKDSINIKFNFVQYQLIITDNKSSSTIFYLSPQIPFRNDYVIKSKDSWYQMDMQVPFTVETNEGKIYNQEIILLGVDPETGIEHRKTFLIKD